MVGPDQAREYVNAWQTITRWTAQGRTWSGHEKDCCFLNLGGGSFADISTVSGIDLADDGRGVAVVDWDQDGRQDLWVSARTAPRIRLLHNEVPAAGHYLALHLEGTQVNRDAIGARVRVRTRTDLPGMSLKSVRAGEGYLSQSSKWLHFGLGNDATPVDLDVIWPDGTTQQLSGLKADRRYVLRQGDSAPREWSRPDVPWALVAGTPEPPVISSRHAHLLSARESLPPLRYQSWEDQPLTIAPDSSRPRLIVLWASWCKPCLEELKSLREARADLDELELDVLALAVDGLGDDKTPVEQARKVAEYLELHFATGRGTVELLDLFQSIHDALFGAKRPLPLPSSFLLDKEGRLVAIHQGPVTLEELRRETERMALGDEELVDASLERPGRWIFRPVVSEGARFVDQGRELMSHGQWEEALTMFRRALADDPQDGTRHYFVGMSLVRLGRARQAESYFRAAIDLAPEFALSHFQLGDLLMQKGDLKGAEAQYLQGVALESNPAALGRLAVLQAMRGEVAEAERYFLDAVRLDESSPDLRSNFGKFLLDQGKLTQAKAQLERACGIPEPPLGAMLNLSWILATSPDDAARDGARAVELAEACRRRRETADPVVLDRLAAAHAEKGDFDLALATIDEALRISKANSPGSKLTSALEARRQLYLEKRPFRLEAR